MIVSEAGRFVVSVPMVMDNARGLLEAGRQFLQPGNHVFDFSRVTEADSSAIAVMLGWLRLAAQSRSTVFFWLKPGQGWLAGETGHRSGKAVG